MMCMKIKTICSVLCICSIFLPNINSLDNKIIQNRIIQDIFIKRTSSNDIEKLRRIIANQDQQFNDAFVDIFGNPIAEELLEFNENDISYTIFDRNENIIGQILFGMQQDNVFNVSYWVDKNFRGKGIGSKSLYLAVSEILKNNPDVILKFEINNSNIVSLKTFEKIFGNQNFEVKKEDHLLECRVLSNPGNNLLCNILVYDNDKLISKSSITKEKLLKIISEDNIKNGVISRQEQTVYNVKKIKNKDQIMNDHPSSVSELNAYIKFILESDEALQNVYITGEVSNFKHHSSGHMYFSLKDENCSVKCIMFSKYSSKVNFDFENGIKIFAYGSISCYEAAGQYQVYVYHVAPAGIGQINDELKKIYNRLEKEGLFDPDKKKPLKKFPRKIGVISSKTGAVIHDISSVLNRRYPLAEIVLCSSNVQGAQSSDQIVESINFLENYPEIDVIIIARGGGSLEDLWSFNNENVVRRISKCKIPVISAVGHDVDYTLCDYVADVRASTPSVAAELASSSIESVLENISSLKHKINNGLDKNFTYKKYILDQFKNMFNLKQIENFLFIKANDLANYKNKINIIFENFINANKLKLGLLKNKIEIYNPENIFKKGYTMVQKDGICISDVDLIEEDSELSLKFRNGSAKFIVKNLKKEYKFGQENIRTSNIRS